MITIPINEKKIFWPVACTTIYGIEVDSIDMMNRLPPDKLEKCRALVYQFGRRKKLTLQELQTLIGVLNFACLVVVSGRVFLLRLIDLTIGGEKPYYRIKFNNKAGTDLATWLDFFKISMENKFF